MTQDKEKPPLSKVARAKGNFIRFVMCVLEKDPGSDVLLWLVEKDSLVDLYNRNVGTEHQTTALQACKALKNEKAFQDCRWLDL